MNIENGQKVKVTIKKIKTINGEPVIKNGFPVVEEFVVEGKVSGVFKDDWCSIYDDKTNHAIIDLR